MMLELNSRATCTCKNQEESGNDEDEEAPPVQFQCLKCINDVIKSRETTFYVAWEWKVMNGWELELVQQFI